jgi:hypothetical protein
MFGHEGAMTVQDELQQLHDRGVKVLRQPDSLTPQQKSDSFAYLMFLKHKQYGKSRQEDVLMGKSKDHSFCVKMQHLQQWQLKQCLSLL